MGKILDEDAYALRIDRMISKEQSLLDAEVKIARGVAEKERNKRVMSHTSRDKRMTYYYNQKQRPDELTLLIETEKRKRAERELKLRELEISLEMSKLDIEKAKLFLKMKRQGVSMKKLNQFFNI